MVSTLFSCLPFLFFVLFLYSFGPRVFPSLSQKRFFVGAAQAVAAMAAAAAASQRGVAVAAAVPGTTSTFSSGGSSVMSSPPATLEALGTSGASPWSSVGGISHAGDARGRGGEEKGGGGGVAFTFAADLTSCLFFVA